jgi:NADH dehydrogenase
MSDARDRDGTDPAHNQATPIDASDGDSTSTAGNPTARLGGRLPHVVIVGGGFAGLAAAKRLKRAPVRVTLVDRRNHHLFQPLLYQVATAALSPAQIAAPIRAVLSRQKNAEVVLAEARRVNAARRVLETDQGDIAYDYLVLATGATHSYFGHDDWSASARGLKTIDDALEIRRRFLLAFEAAENEANDARRRALMTFVIIGAGPTGVETAGAIAEIARTVIRRDFRHIDTSRARVVLVEAMDRVLPAGFPRELSDRALADLRAMGVEVRLNTRVTHVAPGTTDDPPHVLLSASGDAAPERVDAHNIVWAAGVRASPLGASLGVPTDNAGRVVVAPDLSIPGHAEVFVTGDLARCAWSAGPGSAGMVPRRVPRRGADGRPRRPERRAPGRGPSMRAVQVRRQGLARHDRARQGGRQRLGHEVRRPARLAPLGRRPRLLPHQLPQPRRRDARLGPGVSLLQARLAPDHGRTGEVAVPHDVTVPGANPDRVARLFNPCVPGR